MTESDKPLYGRRTAAALRRRETARAAADGEEVKETALPPRSAGSTVDVEAVIWPNGKRPPHPRAPVSPRRPWVRESAIQP